VDERPGHDTEVAAARGRRQIRIDGALAAARDDVQVRQAEALFQPGADVVRPAMARFPGPFEAGLKYRPRRRVPEPPLRAGPVWVDTPRSAAAPRAAEEDAVRLAALAELALRYLAVDRGWPW